MPETLFLTMSVIDRFLEQKSMTRKNLQLVSASAVSRHLTPFVSAHCSMPLVFSPHWLHAHSAMNVSTFQVCDILTLQVGVTAMLIASKYEEIWAPEVRDFVYISDKAYTREQILAMEKLMLNTLKFNLTTPTAFNFLSRFIKAAGVKDNKDLCTYATFLVELSLPDHKMLRYSYSMIASAAVHVAMKAYDCESAYPYALRKHSGFDEATVRPCGTALIELHKKADKASLIAVYKKYSNAKYAEVAKVVKPIDLVDVGAAE